MTAIETLDRPPAGWFVLDVMRRKQRKPDWVALMVDVDPVSERADRSQTPRQVWVHIPGKHGSRDAACVALEELMATRH